MSNFLEQKEIDLEKELDKISSMARINQIREILCMIKDDQIKILREMTEDEKGFIPLSNSLKDKKNIELKAKYEYTDCLVDKLLEMEDEKQCKFC